MIDVDIKKKNLKAVIFDLDGVLVSTDNCHYQGWKKLSDELGIPFDRAANEKFRGVDRMSCLEMLLADYKVIAQEEKIALATRKNDYYLELIKTLSPADILPGATELLDQLDEQKVKKAVGSASKNAVIVLERLGIAERFDTIVTGSDYERGKPAPDVFLTAAKRIGVPPQNCLVIEDALAGVQAAKAAGMRVLGIGNAAGLYLADDVVASLSGITYHYLKALFDHE